MEIVLILVFSFIIGEEIKYKGDRHHNKINSGLVKTLENDYE